MEVGILWAGFALDNEVPRDRAYIYAQLWIVGHTHGWSVNECDDGVLNKYAETTTISLTGWTKMCTTYSIELYHDCYQAACV